MPGITTIQVSQDTKSDLDNIKTRENLRSYDEVIRFLLKRRTRNMRSLYGSTPEINPFVREDDDPHSKPP